MTVLSRFWRWLSGHPEPSLPPPTFQTGWIAPLPLAQMDGLNLDQLAALANERAAEARRRVRQPHEEAQAALETAQAGLAANPAPGGWQWFRSRWLFLETPAYRAWEAAEREVAAAQARLDATPPPHRMDLDDAAYRARLSVEIRMAQLRAAERAAQEAADRRAEEERRRRPPPTDDDFLKD